MRSAPMSTHGHRRLISINWAMLSSFSAAERWMAQGQNFQVSQTCTLLPGKGLAGTYETLRRFLVA